MLATWWQENLTPIFLNSVLTLDDANFERRALGTRFPLEQFHLLNAATEPILGSQGPAVEPGVTADDRASVPRAVTPPQASTCPTNALLLRRILAAGFRAFASATIFWKESGQQPSGQFPVDSDRLGHVIWG